MSNFESYVSNWSLRLKLNVIYQCPFQVGDFMTSLKSRISFRVIKMWFQVEGLITGWYSILRFHVICLQVEGSISVVVSSWDPHCSFLFLYKLRNPCRCSFQVGSPISVLVASWKPHLGLRFKSGYRFKMKISYQNWFQVEVSIASWRCRISFSSKLKVRHTGIPHGGLLSEISYVRLP